MNKKSTPGLAWLTGMGIVLCCLLHACKEAAAPRQSRGSLTDSVSARVLQLMREGDIPGLSLVVVNGSTGTVHSFGNRGGAEDRPVDPATVFELASCSKSFTALGLLNLAREGKLKLDDSLARYFPGFYALYRNEKKQITLRQLLHHTSGIPWNTIADIPPSADSAAIRDMVGLMTGVELRREPGSEHHYATINYDLLGAVMEKVTGLSFESAMRRYVFEPLGLTGTTVGHQAEAGSMATGSRVSFFSAEPFQSPAFRGNFPAGYVLTNGKDMQRWLLIQMGLQSSPLDSLVRISQVADTLVAPDAQQMSAYAMGWEVSLRGDGVIGHEGLNPAFSSSVQFSKRDGVGVAVLANSNSDYTYYIADYVFALLRQRETAKIQKPASGSSQDGLFSAISIALAIYILLLIYYCIRIFMSVAAGKRAKIALERKHLLRLLVAVLLMLPLLLGIYLIPSVVSEVNWPTAKLWSPLSFQTAVWLCLAALAMSLVAYTLSIRFPSKKKYYNSIPVLCILSLLTGAANVAIITILISFIGSQGFSFGRLYYFLLAFFIYVAGRKIVETRLIGITLDIIYEIRIMLVGRLFATHYTRFENLDKGRLYTTLNDDTTTIGNSGRIIVETLTSFFTVLLAFAYMAALSLTGTLLTLAAIAVLAWFYQVVSARSERFFDLARDSKNDYLRYVNGLLEGFKELVIHGYKRNAYQADIEQTTDHYRKTASKARLRFVDAFIIGESFIIIVLALIAILFPALIPGLNTAKLLSFMMILLYLIGPIATILNAIPSIIELKVSWLRVKKMQAELTYPGQAAGAERPSPPETPLPQVQSFEADDVSFAYGEGGKGFEVGPLQFRVGRGTILFITGGNGSGKTTLSKLLCGLYIPSGGQFLINGKTVKTEQLGEYFSVVFSDFYLFQRIYIPGIEGKKERVDRFLRLLELQDKVKLEGDRFSTLDLSRGQRKRLALLLCYLEDRPVYLFDEWAADQDPQFKKVFYHELLPEMKAAGKIIIAISHDELYFDVADMMIHMTEGKMQVLREQEAITLT